MKTPPQNRIVVGTRGSLLAMTQTRWVVGEIERCHPDWEVRVRQITTRGDRATEVPLAEAGQKGIFTAELEEALETGKIDLAVHSAKDLPEVMNPRLAVLCVPRREDPRDAWISRDGQALAALRPGAVVGTGSLRRRSQVRRVRRDVEFCELRGNIDTRIAKVLDRGVCDAAILAMAGLTRAGLVDRAAFPLDVDVMMPAPGQGILAVQGRDEDRELRAALAPVNHRPSALALSAERRIVRYLGGGCTTPIGALASVDGTSLRVQALVVSPEGDRVAQATSTGPAAELERVVDRLLVELNRGGAGDIIAACRTD